MLTHTAQGGAHAFTNHERALTGCDLTVETLHAGALVMRAKLAPMTSLATTRWNGKTPSVS